MSLVDTKALAEKFRAIAADKDAVGELADETIKANPRDVPLVALCNRFKAAANEADTLVICDEVKAKTS